MNGHPDSNGWVIKDGYIYRDGSYLIRKLSDFHLWNGCCHILRFEHLNVPHRLDPNITQDEVIGRLDPYFLRGILGAHLFTDSYFAIIGKPLERFPFRGAIYVTGTGENHSGLTKTFGGERIDATLTEEFGLPLVAFDPRRLWAERAAQAVEAGTAVANRVRRGISGLWATD